MKQTITCACGGTNPIHPHHTQNYEQAGLKTILLENRPYVSYIQKMPYFLFA